VSTDCTASLTKASTFFGVDMALFSKALTTMELDMGSSGKVQKDLLPNDAADNRDSAAKAVYSQLFDWLVATINAKCSDESSNHLRTNFIGILDIFGFEIFETNGFEQLCINYANECLQQQFNTDTFKTETDIYLQEGVSDLVGEIKFADNQDVLTIIAGKGGVLRMLDEEIKLGTRGSSESFFKKMDKAHGHPAPRGKHAKITALITTKAHCSWFKVKHFAGVVQYESTGFLEKNKDTLNGAIVSLLRQSTDPLVKSLFTPPAAAVEDGEGESKANASSSKKRKKKSAKSVSSQFRASLNDLMKSIKETETHYIRCIKSNQQKMPGTFDAPYVLDQLRTGGVFSAADIRGKGFPFRKAHKDFYTYFRLLSYRFSALPTTVESENEKIFCDALVAELSQASSSTTNQVIVGATMVLYQSPAHVELEALRAAVIEEAFKAVDTAGASSITVDQMATVLASLKVSATSQVGDLANDEGFVSFDDYRQFVDSATQ